MADKIQNAYKASKNIYDDVLTQGSFFSRLYIRLFWSGTDDNEIARKVLSFVPADFHGALLDVPVGTAVFTANAWRSLKNAAITCLDYSEDMLAGAKARLFRLISARRPNIGCGFMQQILCQLPGTVNVQQRPTVPIAERHHVQPLAAKSPAQRADVFAQVRFAFKRVVIHIPCFHARQRRRAVTDQHFL